MPIDPNAVNEIGPMGDAVPSPEAWRLLSEQCGLCNGTCEERFEHAARIEIGLLRAEIVLADKIIAARNQILDALPCPVHGQCVPHVMEFIASRKQTESQACAAHSRLTCGDGQHFGANVGTDGVARCDCGSTGIGLMPPRWIPVTDRLPEPGDYLATNGVGVWTLNYSDGQWWTNDDVHPIADDVTHWQPAPEPPK